MDDYWTSSHSRNDSWTWNPSPCGLDAWSQAVYGQSACADFPRLTHQPGDIDPEFAAYWASLSTADKIRGALISILSGGGIGGLLGYLIMY